MLPFWIYSNFGRVMYLINSQSCPVSYLRNEERDWGQWRPEGSSPTLTEFVCQSQCICVPDFTWDLSQIRSFHDYLMTWNLNIHCRQPKKVEPETRKYIGQQCLRRETPLLPRRIGLFVMFKQIKGQITEWNFKDDNCCVTTFSKPITLFPPHRA